MKWDAIIVGGGHNGLVAASYLAKANKKVLVLEKRHIVGGAAVTEEIIPGFHFSRASYVLSLFRPQIIQDLNLKRHGLEWFLRNPSSFTPMQDGRSLLLGMNEAQNIAEIRKFSEKDAKKYVEYNNHLNKLVDFFVPFLDQPPPDLDILFRSGSFKERSEVLKSLVKIGVDAIQLGQDLPSFLEFMTAPASKILNRWFESDVLKATLATDAIIGAQVSPHSPSSAYVLFHHVMGELDGTKGVWAHVRGGMGSVTKALRSAAEEAGVTISVSSPVSKLVIDSVNGSSEVRGVELEDGQKIYSKVVLSNANPIHTLCELVPTGCLDPEITDHISNINCASSSTKINLALDRIPNFKAIPNEGGGLTPMPHHRGTIHFEETIEQIDTAYCESLLGMPSSRPIIEMNLPTSLDPTIAPQGKHIALLFIQYTPYTLKNGSWDDQNFRDAFCDKVFDVIEEYAPGFKSSILGIDMLTPVDLERTFGLPKGNIFHGAMSLDQLFTMRPMSGLSRYGTPVRGLYLCGAGSHPGGGVMGAPGRNSALQCLGREFK